MGINRFAMVHNQWQSVQLKKFRGFFISTIILIFVLLWLYRSNTNLQTWYQHLEVVTKSSSILTQQCRPGHMAPQRQKVALVPINGTRTLMVSAYQEHRLEKMEVRVITVMLRSETVAYRCLFCCQDQLHISEGITNIHTDHFGFAYGTADIMCPLPSGCKTVSHIAVTSAADEFKDNVGNQFVEVKNQEVKSDSFPYNFTVCISTMFDFTNVLQLVQTLEMLQLLGVNRVVVYKTNCSTETQRVLEHYTHKGLVEVIPWSMTKFVNISRSWLPEHGPGDLHYFGQIPALNDCLYRYMYQSRYMAFHDIDEFILPQSVDRWLELLPLLEQKYGTGGCYGFENNVFPNNVMLPKQKMCCPGWDSVPGVNILNHLFHEPILPETHYTNFKIIVNPRIVYEVSVHGLLNPQKSCVWVDRNIARLYHTRLPNQPNLKSDQLIYDDRLLSYSARLRLAVNTVLRECGFLPVDPSKSQQM